MIRSQTWLLSFSLSSKGKRTPVAARESVQLRNIHAVAGGSLASELGHLVESSPVSKQLSHSLVLSGAPKEPAQAKTFNVQLLWLGHFGALRREGWVHGRSENQSVRKGPTWPRLANPVCSGGASSLGSLDSHQPPVGVFTGTCLAGCHLRQGMGRV